MLKAMERYERVVLTNMCMICNDAGEILVEDKVSPSYSGMTFPGGHVEPGEPLTAAVIREVREETGLTIAAPRLCGMYEWQLPDGARYLVFLYRTNQFTGVLRSSAEGRVFWLERTQFLRQNLAQGMESVYAILCRDDLSECVLDLPTGRETLL